MGKSEKGDADNSVKGQHHAQLRELFGKDSPFGNAVSVPAVYRVITGSITSAILLAQIVYWCDKSTNGSMRKNLMFAKTAEELMVETGLGERELKNARKELEALGFISTDVGGWAGHPAIFWHPCIGAINLAIMEFHQAQQETQKNDLTKAQKKQKRQDDFINRLASDIVPNSPYAFGLNVQMLKDETSRSNGLNGQMVMDETSKSDGRNVQMHSAESSVSNTETTSSTTTETTIQKPPTNQPAYQAKGGLVGGDSGFKDLKEELKSMGENQRKILNWFMANVRIYNKNIPFESVMLLIKKLKPICVDFNLNQDHINKILMFSILIGNAEPKFSDFLATRPKTDKHPEQGFKELWLDPINEWVKSNVTAGELNQARSNAIKDGYYDKNQFPFSYITRVNSIVSKRTKDDCEFESKLRFFDYVSEYINANSN
jgi:hypothetical protein